MRRAVGVWGTFGAVIAVAAYLTYLGGNPTAFGLDSIRWAAVGILALGFSVVGYGLMTSKSRNSSDER